MMLEAKRLLLLAISLCWAVQESAADSSPKEEYSAFDSASWAITSSRLSPLLGTDKQSLYNNFIKGCDAAVKEKNGRENFCTFGERQRFEMNAMQPSSCYNYTTAGYAKTRAPPELYAEIKKFFDTHRDRSRIEWKDYNVYHNAWEAPPTFIDLLLNGALTRKIETVVQPILEQWTGQKLRPVSSYGIRLYHNNSILTPHVDRMPLVTSVIIQVDQDVDEPWPLEVYGHDGTATNVTMEPGDMVLYESHSVIHGRPFPMRGNYFANCFIHYEPIEPLEGESLYDPALDLPPYIMANSTWVRKWRQQNPEGWKKNKEATGKVIRQIAVHGTPEELELFLQDHPEDLHHKDSNGWTVVHEASRSGKLQLVKKIIELGVDKDLLTHAGNSPLNVARQYLPERHEVIKYLESIGAQDILDQEL